MVKHNNVVPNAHFRKDWQRRVKTWLDQAGRKKRRRLARKAKAQKVAPRPVAGLLRPSVHCPTQRYNVRVRAGRGFTLEELKQAGINRLEARGVGISVDHRRRNKSLESLQANVRRLKEYKSKLVVIPRGSRSHPKKGDSSTEETMKAHQLKGTVLPIRQPRTLTSVADLTDELRAKRAYATLRSERGKARTVGIRKKRAAEKAEKAKENQQ